MDSSRTKGPRCGVENCRSRWYEEGEDGYLYCENGHQKGGLVVGQDEDAFTTARRDTTRKRKEHENHEKVHKFFTGKAALNLYLKSIQLILRHQTWFLIHEKGLPTELETVVFDLWALRILQLQDKLSNTQTYLSQSQTFLSETDDEIVDESRQSVREKKLKAMPSLLDTLALCYLGIITLRLPTTPGDIHAWVIDERLAYKRAIKLLPAVMREKLPAYYHSVLNPNAIFKLDRFYTVVTDLAIGLGTEYGITWPKLNHPLWLFRLLKDLALPLEVYDGTIQLASYLEYDFTLPCNSDKRVGFQRLPEAQIAACLVVCTKLMYPFDSLKRYPRSSSEPSAITIDWDDWHEHMSAAKKKLRGESAIYTLDELEKLQEKDVYNMSNDQLDQYLDWYQNTMLDDADTLQTEDDGYRTALYSLFPIESPHSLQPPHLVSKTLSAQDALEVVRTAHAGFKGRRAVKEGDETPGMLRPGQMYSYFKEVDDLPQQARRFYEEVSRVIGLEMEELVRMVFWAEKKMAAWKMKCEKKLSNEG